MALNVKHQFFAAQIARRSMRELGGGSIVNFTSTAWMLGIARLVALFGGQGGDRRPDQRLAREFGPDNIRVNAIAPGAIIDRATAASLAHREGHRRFPRATMPRPQPCRRKTSRDWRCFSSADDSAMITKQCFLVDGGLR